MSLYEELQERLESVVEYDGYFMALCPFHADHRPSLRVQRKYFDCMAASCGKTGTLKYLASQLSRVNLLGKIYTSSRPVLPKWRKWERMYGDINGIAQAAHDNLFKFTDYQTYFKKRKIDQFIKQGLFGCISGWITFPIFDKDQRIIDIVCRAWRGKKDTKYVLRPNDKRESPYLYCPNWRRVNESDNLYVVFGMVDAWAMEALGFPSVTGTAGKSINPELIKELRKRTQIIPDMHEEKDAYKLEFALGWRASVITLPYPEGTKDPDGIRMQYGDGRLKTLIMENTK